MLRNVDKRKRETMWDNNMGIRGYGTLRMKKVWSKIGEDIVHNLRFVRNKHLRIICILVFKEINKLGSLWPIRDKGAN